MYETLKMKNINKEGVEKIENTQKRLKTWLTKLMDDNY